MSKIYKEGSVTEKAIDIVIDLATLNVDIDRYSKPYRGLLKTKTKTDANYKFYDEKEWRYIPPYKDSSLEPFLSLDEYAEYQKTNSKPHFPNKALIFKAEDISYLIVENEDCLLYTSPSPRDRG